MKKFLIKSFIAAGLLVAFMMAYGFFCDWFFGNPHYYDHYGSKRAWSMKHKLRDYDYGVLGSSRAYGSFDMVRLNELTGLSGINLGANGSGYADNFLVLYHFLDNNNLMDTLLLQVDIYSLNSKKSFSNAFHTYQFLPQWGDPVVKDALLPYIDTKDEYLWTILPATRYFTYNKYFSPKEVLRRVKVSLYTADSPFDVTVGGPPSYFKDNEDRQNEVTIGAPSKRSLDSLDIHYLNRIIRLCKERGIKVIAYQAPELLEQQQSITNYKSLNAEIQAIIQSHGIRFIPPDSVIERDPKYFANPTHINTEGRKLFTDYLGSAWLNKVAIDR